MADQNPRLFHRNQLAENLAKRVMASNQVSADSGIFLSAPRRTGKSTFLREDFTPALEAAGAIVIYADLWEDREADPEAVIIGSIKSELAKHANVLKRIAMKVGVDQVSLGGASFNLDRIGLGKDISITAALTALSDETKKPIALIIDEAQHAITTKAGNSSLFALKAARDEINSSSHHGLHIIATGSSQAKLAMLRNSKDQAFFGAFIFPFPNLDIDYVKWFCSKQPFSEQLDVDNVMALFEKASYRPEILNAAARTIMYDLSLTPDLIAERFGEEVENEINAINQSIVSVVNSLPPTQYAVLKVMSESGENYKPFDAETIDRYKEVLKEKKADSEAKMDSTTVQQALLALQDKSLVWKENRGVYALEDTSVVELLSDESKPSLVKTKKKP